ncbi:hypothetical protein FA15DRAFT_549779, partial [Coprinopsis marcescibilis]
SYLALIYYDYFLTLPQEVEQVWQAPWTPSTFFYVLCRYSLASSVLEVFSISEEINVV